MLGLTSCNSIGAHTPRLRGAHTSFQPLAFHFLHTSHPRRQSRRLPEGFFTLMVILSGSTNFYFWLIFCKRQSCDSFSLHRQRHYQLIQRHSEKTAPLIEIFDAFKKSGIHKFFEAGGSTFQDFVNYIDAEKSPPYPTTKGKIIYIQFLELDFPCQFLIYGFVIFKEHDILCN